MEQYTTLIIIAIWFILVATIAYSYGKPSKKIVKKYGKPNKHIYGSKGLFGLPVRSFNSTVFIDIYSDFLVISYGKDEFIINRDYKQFEIYTSFMNTVLEFDINGKSLQICMSGKQASVLKEWFGID